MARCQNIIGDWLPHPCGGEWVNGYCQRCGAAANEPVRRTTVLGQELGFSAEELERFGVILAGGEPGCNPSEWGVDPFRDFT